MCAAYCKSVHGSNTLGCVDGDKQEMNTVSECQVEPVRGSEQSMIELLESMKGGGGRRRHGADAVLERDGWCVEERERTNARRCKHSACMHVCPGLEE